MDGEVNVRSIFLIRRILITSLQQAKRVIWVIAGFTVLLIGIVMIVLPGPAIIVIPMGLAILATEFIWARRLLARIRAETQVISAQLDRIPFFTRLKKLFWSKTTV